MAELKTKKNEADVIEFISKVDDERKRNDSFKLIDIMKEALGEEPKMWGDSIIGFGDHHYIYESGREGDWFIAGFSPRKNQISLYIMSGVSAFPELVDKLGKIKKAKVCIYVKKLEDINTDVLKELLIKSAAELQNKKKS